ncbi:MAG: ribbon-helix-helix domain-containing protein [Nitrososphaeria archaeon]|nr:ribbon-helix-helix domain-containing protein [Nitrososphaeria archaeon]
MKKVKITISIKEELLTKIDTLVRQRQIKELEGGSDLKSSRSSLVEELLEKALKEHN